MPRNTWWSRRRNVFQQNAPVADGVHAHAAPPNKKKQHAVAGLSEFVGTLLFLFFAYGGTNVAMESPGEVTDPVPRLLYISLAFGISLLVNVWAFFRIGGGMFNPAVALGMWIIGAIDIVRLLIVVLAEITGSVAAAALVGGLIPGPLVVSTELADGVSVAQGLFLEAFLTTELVFVIFMLANERHRATFLAPVGIGLALFICELI